MEEVKLLLDVLAVIGQVLERGGLVLVVNTNQVVLEQALDVALDAQLLKRLGVLWYGEHGRGARGEDGQDLLPHAVPLPLGDGHPHDLLGRAGTLDDAGWLGEDGGAGLDVLDVLPDLLGGLVGVDGGDLAGGVLQGLGEPLDAVEVGLEARGDDEVLVREVHAIRGLDLVVLRVELGDLEGVVGDTVRDDAGHGPPHVAQGP